MCLVCVRERQYDLIVWELAWPDVLSSVLPAIGLAPPPPPPPPPLSPPPTPTPPLPCALTHLDLHPYALHANLLRPAHASVRVRAQVLGAIGVLPLSPPPLPRLGVYAQAHENLRIRAQFCGPMGVLGLREQVAWRWKVLEGEKRKKKSGTVRCRLPAPPFAPRPPPPLASPVPPRLAAVFRIPPRTSLLRVCVCVCLFLGACLRHFSSYLAGVVCVVCVCVCVWCFPLIACDFSSRNSLLSILASVCARVRLSLSPTHSNLIIALSLSLLSSLPLSLALALALALS